MNYFDYAHYLADSQANAVIQNGANSIVQSLEWAGDALKVWAGALGAIGVLVYFFSAARE